MVELPFKDRFSELPEVDLQEVANYFNLELTLGFEGSSKKLSPKDFTYLGVYRLQGRETMVWEVKGLDICATVQPYEDAYLIAMDGRPSEAAIVNK